VALLVLGLAALTLVGWGIDYVRHASGAAVQLPRALAELQRLPPMGGVAVIAVGVVGVALLRALLNYWYSTSLAIFVQRDVVAALRARVYEKMQHLSFRFFDDQPSGAIINRVTGDVQQLRMFVDGVVMQSVILVVSLAVYAVYMVRLHPLLTVACLATSPLLWLATWKFSRSVRPAYARNRQLVDSLVHYLAECVQGIGVIKGFSLADEVRCRFGERNQEVLLQQNGIFHKVSLFTPLINFLTQANLAVLLFYGGWLVYRGELALGSGLVVFAGLLQQFSAQASSVATVANSMQQSLIGAGRVFEILDAPVEIRSPELPEARGRAGGRLEFENVRFAYRAGEPVLDGVSFQALPGMRVAILGATGAGKTTLLSLVPRFYDPVEGRVLLDGCDLRRWELADLRRNIGIVFQETFLFNRSVAENIAFGHPEATRAQVEKAARIACADTFVRALPQGYDTLISEAGANLSGGQRQRLAIARALLLEPPILLMDDPSAALDPHTEAEITEALQSAMAGRTTLLVAHRAGTLRGADVILVLDSGRIVQTGTHDELAGVPGPYRNALAAQSLDPQ
jgi:ATP-binding cassette subfamily B protein